MSVIQFTKEKSKISSLKSLSESDSPSENSPHHLDKEMPEDTWSLVAAQSLSSTSSTANLAPSTNTGSVSKVYNHWADGDAAKGTSAEWNNNILSANKSDYFEGQVIPHVFIYKASNNAPLVAGQTYSFNITYNHYQANTKAGGFAFMTDYNVSRDPSPGHDPDLSIYSGKDIVKDTTMDNGANGIQGSFYTVGADITKVSGVSYTGTGTQDAHVTVTFKYTGGTTSNGFAEIYYGLSIAKPGEVGASSNGASAWTGGSLQTTVDIGGSGATSLQLSPDAIIHGEISGMKFNDLNGDGVREANEPGLAGWTIFLDTNHNGQLDSGETSVVTRADDLATAANELGTYSFSVTPDANPATPANDAYSVREVQQPGWTQTTANPGPITITPINPTAKDVNFGNLQEQPSLAIAKSALPVTGGNGDTLANAAGDVLNYTITVTNTGNVALTGVSVTDSLTGNLLVGGTLAPGAHQDFNTSYTLTQADLDSQGGGDGDVDNTATADSNETGPSDASAAVPLGYSPAMTLQKVFLNVTGGNGDTLANAVGDVLNYTVTVTNTGNITLTGITVIDPLTGQSVSGATLAPGAHQDFNTSYTLTQADLDHAGNAGSDGNIDNTATADSNETGSLDASATVPLVYDPMLTVAKTFDNVTGGNGDALANAVGDVLNYTVTVTNTGNVTLTGVSVTDPLTGQNVSGATLAPGAHQDFNTSYTLTQADLDSQGGGDGDMDNTATADSNETGPSDASAAVPLGYSPAMTLQKVFLNVTGGNGDTLANAVGDVLNYTVTVTNTGNITLTGITVIDPLTGQNVSGATLAPGAHQDFNTSYILTQADLDSKGGGDSDIDNTAMADSNETGPSDASAAVPLGYSPAMTVQKVFLNVTGGDGNALADAQGDILNYEVFVKNTGNITLTGVSVDDPLTNQHISAVTLAPGEVKSYVSHYTLTQADLDNNGGGDSDIDNTATADSDQTTAIEASARAPIVARNYLTLNKVYTGSTGPDGNTVADSAGDVLHYTIQVANNGNTTLTNVHVLDTQSGLDETLAELAVGAQHTYDATYILQQSDLDTNGGGDGSIENTATAVSKQTATISDTESATLVSAPGIGVDKYFIDVTGGNGNGKADLAGESINYGTLVFNAGNVTLTDVSVMDEIAGLSVTGLTLAPGESKTYLSSYILTQQVIDSHGNDAASPYYIHNSVTVDSLQTAAATDDELVPLLVTPALLVDKKFLYVDGGDGDGTANAAGDVLHYTVTVSNVGNEDLTHVTIKDPLLGIDMDLGSLSVNSAPVTQAETYTLTQADLDNYGNPASSGFLTNTVTAASDQSPSVSDSESVPVITKVAMQYDESYLGADGGNGNAIADFAGDILHYRFTATNLGNVTLTHVVIKDNLTGVNVDVGSIAPGQHQDVYDSYTLTQADLDNNAKDGFLFNDSTATSPQGGTKTDSENAYLYIAPSVDLTKYVSVDNGANWFDANTLETGPTLSAAAGIAPMFRFVVQNTGNVTLTNVVLSDPGFDLNGSDSGADLVIGSLAPSSVPGFSMDVTGSYATGANVNVATVTATVVGIPTPLQDVDAAHYLGVAA